MLKSFRTHALICLPFLLFAVGCGEATPDGMPTLYSTTITVTQDGVPLNEAAVQLVPVDPSTNRWVSGASTDSSGTAVIRTHGKFAGAPAGSYKVTIQKVADDSAAASDDPGATNNGDSFHTVAKNSGA